ncbi:MAG: hypothetical protein HFH47_03385 [Bacilli bacterium]|nr:hypothetical protein [Bacilli bacterium]
MDTVINVINKVKSELAHAENNDGLCYYACNNVCYDLENLNIPAEILNIREMAEVDYDHYFVLTSVSGEIKHLLIDLTFSQFSKKDNEQLRFFGNWPKEELEKNEKGKILSDNLTKQGYSLITDEDLYLYLNCFNPNYECFFTLDDIMSFKTR